MFIQRSKGYSTRKSLTSEEIGNTIDQIKRIRSDVYVLVDNCYGEFTEDMEPSNAGADLVVGSLIKNPGGGLASTGAYAVGTRKAIEQLSNRLTSPGIGRDVGAFPSGYVNFYQGLFMAPHIVAEALKGALLVGRIFDKLGYDTYPHWTERRSTSYSPLHSAPPMSLFLSVRLFNRPLRRRPWSLSVGDAWIRPSGDNGSRHLHTGGVH